MQRFKCLWLLQLFFFSPFVFYDCHALHNSFPWTSESYSIQRIEMQKKKGQEKERSSLKKKYPCIDALKLWKKTSQQSFCINCYQDLHIAGSQNLIKPKSKSRKMSYLYSYTEFTSWFISDKLLWILWLFPILISTNLAHATRAQN